MVFGAKGRKRAAPGAAATTSATKKSKEAPFVAEGDFPASQRLPLSKTLSASDLLCDEVVVERRGVEGKTMTDLHCYESLEDKMVPCKLVRLTSRKGGDSKDDDNRPSPVDTTVSSMGSWWSEIDSSRRVLPMQDTPTQPDTTIPRLEKEYHHVQAVFSQAASNRHAPIVSSDSAKQQRIARGLREVQLEEYPIDWSIKTSAKITCKRPFDFCTTLPSLTQSRSLLSFVRGSDTLETNAQANFRSSLLQWRHPAHKIPQPLAAQFAKYIGGARTHTSQDDWATTRVAEWEDAFYSLYHMLRQQECEYFYYIGSIFTVLFIAARDDKPTRAYLTNSTKSLRKKIDAENIEYTLPLVDRSAADAENERASEREELRMLRKTTDLNVRETSNLGFVDGGVESLMSFQGLDAVHGLFDFLQSRPHDKDVPELISPSPFLHACLKQLRVKDSRSLSAATGAVPGSEVFTLEVEGLIMPSAMRGLMGALQQQQTSFSAVFKTDTRSVSLNVDQASSLGTEGQRAVVYSARCMDDGVFMISTSANG